MGFQENKSFAESPKSHKEKNSFSPDREKKSNKKVRINDEPEVEYNWKRASQKAKDEDFERDN
jgi:hypothetical protein